MAAAIDSNRLCSSRSVIASAGDVTKTFLIANLDERVRKMAMRWLRTAARLLSTTLMPSSANADESDYDNNDDASSNEGRGEEHRQSMSPSSGKDR